MTNAMLNERTNQLIEKTAAAELEAERLADRQRATEQLAVAQIEWDIAVPELEQAADKAKAKLERAKAAVKAANDEYDAAWKTRDGKRLGLSDAMERARSLLATSADPAWGAFEHELRNEAAAALSVRRDLLGANKQRLSKPNVDDLAYNDRCRNRWQACMRLIEKVRDCKRDPIADPNVEIQKLRDSLPVIVA